MSLQEQQQSVRKTAVAPGAPEGGDQPPERPLDALIASLLTEPQRFEFFQAVRLLQCAVRGGESSVRRGRSPRIGTDAMPEQEAVKLTSHTSLHFPGHDLVSVKQEPETSRYVLKAAVMGLTGAAGVLPVHYAKLVLDRVRRNDLALRDFLDIFNHRALSFFYRSWEKYRIPVQYERSELEGREDPVTQCLYALVGMGGTALSHTARSTSCLRGRLAFPDSTLIRFAGFFATRARSAAALGQMLAELAGVRAEVSQFRGQWLHLSVEDMSLLPGPACPEGRNHQLGEDVLIGSRVWSGESRFRVRLGPMSALEFQRLSPGSTLLQGMSELTALYVGIGLEFDIQPLLRAEEIPPTQLGGESRLGWNTWMVSKPRARHGDEAVFRPFGAVAPLS